MTDESKLRGQVEAYDWHSRHRFIHHNYTDAQIHPYASRGYANWIRGVSGTDATFPGDETMWFEAILQMKCDGVVGDGPEI